MYGEHFFDDYGITALATLFHMDWMHEEADQIVVRFVSAAADEAAVVRDDARRLLGMGLTDADLRDLWSALGWHSPRSGREWFDWIAAECDKRLEGLAPGDQDYGLSLEPFRDEALAARVIAEIDVLGPSSQRGAKARWEPVAERMKDVLRRCCVEASPELGFRLLLRILVQNSIGIGADQYERYEVLARDFRQGEYPVGTVRYLTIVS
jgi:hypothetical protein